MTFESVLVDILTILAIVGIAYFINFLKKKTQLDKDENTLDLVDVAVSAAEQMFINGTLTSSQRKSTAISILSKLGVDYEEGGLVDDFIEAAVRQLNIDQKIGKCE